MKQLAIFLIYLFLSASPAFADPKPALPIDNPQSGEDQYLLAPGDLVEISVWKEESLQKVEALVAPDGNITFPLVGTVMAAGKPISALESSIVSKLADYIAEPVVTVKLLQNNGNTIFVIGKVNKPGIYPVNRRIDVMQALSLAGGLTVFADTGSTFSGIFGGGGPIHVLRRVGNVVKVFQFDYDDVVEGKHLEQNIILEPGDTVTVP